MKPYVKFLIPLVLIELFIAFGFGRVVGNLIKTTDRAIKRGIKHLEPIVEHRLKAFNEYGKNWSEKPVCISIMI